IRAVFFDAAGTLLTVRGSVGEIYARLAREHGKEVEAAALEAGFRRCFPQAPAMAFPGAAPEQLPELERQWWRDLVQRVFAALGPFPTFDAYFEALFACFAQPQSWQLYPDAEDTLHRLRRRGLRLGVISNFDSRLFGILEGLGIAHFFDSVVISARAGAAKPDRAIFLQALSALDVRPEEALHVGDSYEADVVGARAAGLVPVFIDRHPRRHAETHSFTIASLAELPAVVDTYRPPALRGC
ncbi:MAG: HAD-IA family hydrolase, partial [Thermodesulfobacteriota bacterium]